MLTTMATITYGLGDSGIVTIPNFSTFMVKEHAAHMGRNPNTGEKIMIAGKKQAVFKPGKVTEKAII